jgi:hypothetical protein
VPFLGAAIRFDGTLALPRAKWSTMLRDIRARITRTACLAGDEPALSELLTAVVNDAFDVRSELAAPQAQLVADLVSDRSQLRELDYLLELAVAEAVTGRRGPRAFREMPPRQLRGAGLTSRVVARNR